MTCHTQQPIANNKLHAMDEIFFHQIHIWPPYSVYMNDLATKIATILVTIYILPCGTHLDLRHMAPI